MDLDTRRSRVLEDGVAQKVEVFQEAVAPVSIMLALDGSGSMKRAAAGGPASGSAFVGALRPDDPLGVLMFADGAGRWRTTSSDRARVLRGRLSAYIAPTAARRSTMRSCEAGAAEDASRAAASSSW